MTDKSQTVKDVIKESQNKIDLGDIVIHTNLPGDMFHQASKFDPVFYKGEARAYRSDGQSYESSLKSQERMSEKSKDLENWLGEQKYDASKRLPQQDVGSSFEDRVRQYFDNEGKELHKYLSGKQRDFYKLSGIGTKNIGNAVAGVAAYGEQAALFGSHDFEKKISMLAAKYRVPEKLARRYVFDHEMVHLSQKGKYGNNEIAAESDVEHTLKSFYQEMGKKNPAYAKEYAALESIAGHRAANVASTYGGVAKNGGLAKGAASYGSSYGAAKAA